MYIQLHFVNGKYNCLTSLPFYYSSAGYEISKFAIKNRSKEKCRRYKVHHMSPSSSSLVGSVYDGRDRRYGSATRDRANIWCDVTPGSISPHWVQTVHAAFPSASGCPHVGHIGRSACVSKISSSSHATKVHGGQVFRNKSK